MGSQVLEVRGCLLALLQMFSAQAGTSPAAEGAACLPSTQPKREWAAHSCPDVGPAAGSGHHHRPARAERDIPGDRTPMH